METLAQRAHNHFADEEGRGTGNAAYIVDDGDEQWELLATDVVGTCGEDGWEFFAFQTNDKTYFALIEDNDNLIVQDGDGKTVYERDKFTFTDERATAEELRRLGQSALFQQH